MKKLSIYLVFALFALTANAQIKTLGLRLGWGAEISAQTKSGGFGRSEFDLGLYRNYACFTGAYHVVNKLGGDGFKWYYGLGGTVGFEEEFGISAGPVGVLGLEYNFDAFPIQLSADYRPEFLIVHHGAVDFDANFNAVGLGIRYIF